MRWHVMAMCMMLMEVRDFTAAYSRQEHLVPLYAVSEAEHLASCAITYCLDLSNDMASFCHQTKSPASEKSPASQRPAAL